MVKSINLQQFRSVVMKTIVFIFTFTFLSFAFAQKISLDEIRKQYVKGAASESEAKDLLKSLRKESSLTPVMLAYKGATQALMAKYAKLPTKKYSLAKKGMAIINNAISKDPENIEIRYIRFTIQDNVPSFLGLSGDLKKDKDLIIKNHPKRKEYQVDDNFFKEMVSFLIQSDECSEEEIIKLKTAAQIE
jgi:hypothetical protein